MSQKAVQSIPSISNSRRGRSKICTVESVGLVEKGYIGSHRDPFPNLELVYEILTECSESARNLFSGRYTT